MLTLQQAVSLKPYNTFGIDVFASNFVSINDVKQLIDLAENKDFWSKEKLILGGGSNVLLTGNFDGLVVKMNTKGIEVVKETDTTVQLKVQAGENWHQFVLHTIENGFGGIENLSLIPGCVGASPMQNIGAYGVEIKDVFVELEAFHIEKKEFHTFQNYECEFGYRTSIFKTREKGNYIITSVTFELSKHPTIHTEYGAIKAELEKREITNPTIKDVSDVVIAIRQSKLPDPSKIGNAGSFFKNPIVPKSQFIPLHKDYPLMPHYFIDEDEVKIPAGWLIEQCGFKGKQVGNTGTYKNQALILVNHGNASGLEIWNHAKTIQQTVFKEFGIEIEPEVNLI